MISARPKARMTSPIATAGRYVSAAIQTRMVGSMERYLTRASAWPSLSGSTGSFDWLKITGSEESFRTILKAKLAIDRGHCHLIEFCGLNTFPSAQILPDKDSGSVAILVCRLTCSLHPTWHKKKGK